MRAPLLGLGLLLGCSSPATHAGDGGGAPRPAALDAGVADARLPPATDAAAALPAAPPGKVKIFVNTDPPRRAEVFWGKKNMGRTPLSFERPQNSGPVDLVIRHSDYLPVHVRVYTERNDKVTTVLTRPEDKMKLLGAKQEIVKEDPGKPATP